MHVSYWIPRSYLTGVAQVQLLMTPVKYEWDLKNVTDTFARSTILLTEKLTNGTLVTPTMGLSKIKAERESRGEYLNSLLIIRLSLTGKFKQNIIVLCICHHDMVAIMMSNPRVGCQIYSTYGSGRSTVKFWLRKRPNILFRAGGWSRSPVSAWRVFAVPF